MTDQDLAARVAALENYVTRLCGVLCERKALRIADVVMIEESVDDLALHGVRATPPGCAYSDRPVDRAARALQRQLRRERSLIRKS